MADTILATVAGVDITEKDIDNVIAGYLAEEQAKMQNPTVRNKILEQLISTRLFALEAREKDLDKTEEFTTLLEKLKDEVLGQMMVTELVKDLKVSTEEKQAFYDENKDQFVMPPQVSAKHILVETKDKALEITKEIQNGDITFEEAAKKYSSCPSKERGGDLGYFQRGQMVSEFENVAFKGDIGKITEPVETQFGWHIVLVNDKKDQEPIKFEDAEEMIHNRLMRVKQKEMYAAELNRLSEKFAAVKK